MPLSAGLLGDAGARKGDGCGGGGAAVLCTGGVFDVAVYPFVDGDPAVVAATINVASTIKSIQHAQSFFVSTSSLSPLATVAGTTPQFIEQLIKPYFPQCQA